MSTGPTTTGTVEDVMAFFRVSLRTVREWYLGVNGGKPRLTSWHEGRNVRFGEESVVELRVKFLRAGRAFAPGEAEEIARRGRRTFLEVRSSTSEELAELRARVERLETPWAQSRNSHGNGDKRSPSPQPSPPGEGEASAPLVVTDQNAFPRGRW